MELLDYDKNNKVATIKITDVELVDLHSVFAGVLSTFQKQDATILGIQKDRAEEVTDEIMKVLKQRLQTPSVP